MMKNQQRKKKGTGNKIPVEKNAILQAATHQWLHVSQISFLLDPETSPLSINKGASHRLPPSGTLILYDRCATRRYKDDGYSWVKKRNSNKVREDHVKLRINGVKKVYGSYVHCIDNPTFHRRAYHLIDGPSPAAAMLNDKPIQSLVLVHYLDTQIASQNRSLQHSFQGSNFHPLPKMLSQMVPNCSLALNHESTEAMNQRLASVHQLGNIHPTHESVPWMNDAMMTTQSPALMHSNPITNPYLNFDRNVQSFRILSPTQNINDQVLNINNKRPFYPNALCTMDKRRAFEKRREQFATQIFNPLEHTVGHQYNQQVMKNNESTDEGLSPEYFSSLCRTMKDMKDEDLNACVGNQTHTDNSIQQIFSDNSLGGQPQLSHVNGLRSREMMNFFHLE